MRAARRFLSRDRIEAFYDRLGSLLDTQAFYEDDALEALADGAGFEEATRVVELGCGTGRFAARLLEERLPAGAGYLGCDLSATMAGLAADRLRAFGRRALVVRADALEGLPFPDAIGDRFVSTYVLDLLSPADIARALGEARRVLAPGGRLAVVSITGGTGPLSKAVMATWSALHRLAPGLIGGCRPIELRAFIRPPAWEVTHHRVVVDRGVASEVVVATGPTARGRPGSSSSRAPTARWTTAPASSSGSGRPKAGSGTATSGTATAR